MFHSPLPRPLRIILSIAIISVVILICNYLPQLNRTAASLSLVLVTLVIAKEWGFVESLVASIMGGIGFDYFFLPPRGIVVTDLQDSVALLFFLATAIIGSQLSASVKKSARRAELRRKEVEKLYMLQSLVHKDHDPLKNLRRICEQIEQVFAFEGVAIYLEDGNEIYRSGSAGSLIPEDELRKVERDGTTFQTGTSKVKIVLLDLGMHVKGTLGVCGNLPEITLLQAIGNMVAVSLERAHATEEAHLAEAVRKSEELKSVLLDSLAHELKMPLTSIKAGVTCLLSQDHDSNREILGMINEETDRLNRLVGDTIEIARIEAGKIHLDKDLYNIHELVEAVLSEAEPRLAGRPVMVQSAASLPEAEFDFGLVKIVLKQLLDNAVKFSPAGSPVTLSCGIEEDSVVVRVVDSGLGIPEEEQGRIFEDYYRSTAYSNVPGTGMGLAIARRIIEAHGGRIGVTSRQGAGSIFHFSLPLHKELALSAKLGS